jgi:hypothetical protein
VPSIRDRRLTVIFKKFIASPFLALRGVALPDVSGVLASVAFVRDAPDASAARDILNRMVMPFRSSASAVPFVGWCHSAGPSAGQHHPCSHLRHSHDIRLTPDSMSRVAGVTFRAATSKVLATGSAVCG